MPEKDKREFQAKHKPKISGYSTEKIGSLGCWSPP